MTTRQKQIKLNPIRFPKGQKQAIGAQFGAVCYRIKDGKTQVLLVTTRSNSHWIVPKGWPIEGLSPDEVAKTEAYEEAGVKGKVDGNCIGVFTHYPTNAETEAPNVIALFPLRVSKLHKDFPERSQRLRKWYSPKKAAEKVRNPELAQMLRHFSPPEPSAAQKD